MKNKLYRISLLLVLTMIGVGITGCSSKIENMDTVPADQVKHIVIETGGNDIIVQESEQNEVSVSVIGYDGKLIVQEGDAVNITIPMPKPGINFNEPKTLYVKIPSEGIESLTIISEVGAVQVKEVQVEQIEVTTEYGNISAIGLEGLVDAGTELGKITAGDSFSGTIGKGHNDRGAICEGILGSENGGSIVLRTTVGDIGIE